MTLKAFLFLFVVTMVAVVASAFIAERLVGPGLERGVIIAVLSSLVVFPAARWAEYRGWIKGTWSPGGELREAQEARKEREAREAEEAPDAQKNKQIAAGENGADPRAGDHTPPGDPR